MNRLPTFIKGALEDYSKHRTVDDEYARYRSLENAFAITIKYVGATLSLIAADHLGDDGRSEVWDSIFRSSGLGGWLDAARLVCKNSRRLPLDARKHCRDYTLYKQHPRRDVLSEVSTNLATVTEELNSSYGYKLSSIQGASVLRALEVAVELRNKSAHGALKVTFFERIEESLFAALKQLLDIMSFDQFTFYGRYGRSNAISFLEPGAIGRRVRDAHVWVESPLLKDGFTDHIPFVSYSEDARDIFFLNSAVYDGEAEYIDYRTGTVTYREVTSATDMVDVRSDRDHVRPRNYTRHSEFLENLPLTWVDMPLSTSRAESADEVPSVYLFVTDVRLGTQTVQVILYVGKTKNIRHRLRQYLRIKKGYDTSRAEISAMFRTYGNEVRMKFAKVSTGNLSAVERAIYETTMPEYNLIAPTEGEPEGETT